MKKYLIMDFLLVCLFLLLTQFLSAQNDSTRKNLLYTNILAVKILNLDTVTIVDEEYLKNSKISQNNFKVLSATVEILSVIQGKTVGKFQKIISELVQNEHSCPFNFLKGEKYIIYSYSSKYTSKAIISRLRKNFLRLDCYNLPTQIHSLGLYPFKPK